MTTLYHYTCSHGSKGIGIQGELRPNPISMIGVSLVWLTDLDVPFDEPLGLTSHMLSCDRKEHRYRVTDDSTCVPWIGYEFRDRQLEIPGTMPRHWWVSEKPVSVVYDPVGAVAP